MNREEIKLGKRLFVRLNETVELAILRMADGSITLSLDNEVMLLTLNGSNSINLENINKPEEEAKWFSDIYHQHRTSL